MLWKSAVVLVISTATLTGCGKERPEKAGTVAATPVAGTLQPAPDGESLFKQYCAACHPNGGNVSDPDRTLYGSALKKNRISAPEDIVRILRKPLSRMIRFDAATLPDRDARAIAEYVLKTFR